MDMLEEQEQEQQGQEEQEQEQEEQWRRCVVRAARGCVSKDFTLPEAIGTLPEAIIIEVSTYCGPPFYQSEPKWVAILPCVSLKEGTRMTRRQFPLVAGFALTRAP